ncbi:unnamed protein product [Taenia asiatica]|uniref:Uncharacterized protein n=1 Tax=Taenia asiatica TaxID=60517 RepID=A0A0R3W2C4_TAEAS|nr:unnamed protein product [Taenia asiatica]
MLSGRAIKSRKHKIELDPKTLVDEAYYKAQPLTEDPAFNTNAKATTSSPDRLKKIFADRQSHRSLAEQKVSDWLLKYRSYTHIPPKDLSDVPEDIWAPLDIDRSSKNNAASALGCLRCSSKVTESRLKRRVLNCSKGRPPRLPSDSQALAFGRKKIWDGKGHHPYFFEPPYKKADYHLKTREESNRSMALRSIENYMNVSRGLLKGSRLMS